MNYEILTDTIKKQIIRSFAMLDAWFDHDLITGYAKPPGLSWNVINRLTGVISTNDLLLREINRAVTDPSLKANDPITDYASELVGVAEAAEGFVTLTTGMTSPEYPDLPAMRERLRDQLYDCLLLLELLTNDAGLRCQTSFRVNNGDTFTVYQLIYFMAMVIQKEAKKLDQIPGSVQDETMIRQGVVTDACNANTPLK